MTATTGSDETRSLWKRMTMRRGRGRDSTGTTTSCACSTCSSSSVVNPWLSLLLLLVVLGMNYQSVLQLEQQEMMEQRRMMTKRSNQQSIVRAKPWKNKSSNATRVSFTKSGHPRYLPIPPREDGIVKGLVSPGDFIYYKDNTHLRWDGAPIVLESHKLVFFSIPKVGCTVWKQLFRRMMGYKDWQSQDSTKNLPHDPSTNGLKYLYDFGLEQANEIMTSPEWTRAIMVRDPKIRFLSAFLDKAVSNDHVHIANRCCPDKTCIQDAQTILGFLQLIRRCDDEHWMSQHERVDAKFWPYMDFVGHVETAANDARRLLRKIGAWDEFGATGWGEDGSLAIFQSTDTTGAGEHATWSQWKVWQWYTPESEELVERYYQADYMNPLFHFTRGTCLTCPKKETKS